MRLTAKLFFEFLAPSGGEDNLGFQSEFPCFSFSSPTSLYAFLFLIISPSLIVLFPLTSGINLLHIAIKAIVLRADATWDSIQFSARAQMAASPVPITQTLAAPLHKNSKLF